MLSLQEKSMIRALITDARWPVIEKLAELVNQKIEQEPVLKDSQWNTIKSVIIKEGKKQGVKRFLDELLNQAE